MFSLNYDWEVGRGSDDVKYLRLEKARHEAQYAICAKHRQVVLKKEILSPQIFFRSNIYIFLFHGENIKNRDVYYSPPFWQF